METGYLHTQDAMLHYLYVPSQCPNAPLLLYLAGGPAVSFWVPVLERQATRLREHFHILFIDQPAPTGFSYRHHPPQDTTQELDEALMGWNTTNLVILGESYGAKDAVSLARYRLEHGEPVTRVILLSPFLDPERQLQGTVSAYAHQGLVDPDSVQPIEDKMLEAIHRKDWEQASTYHEYLLDQLAHLTPIDPMNSQQLQQPSSLETCLNQPHVQRQLGAVPQRWISPHPDVRQFRRRAMLQSQRHDLAYLLDQRIPVLIVGGQNDLRVTPQGLWRMVHEISWHGQRRFQRQEQQSWGWGTGKHVHPLTVRIVFRAGHHLTHDQPDVLCDLLCSKCH